MKIHVATPGLIVFEYENGAITDREKAQVIVRSVLEVKGFEQWSSIEIEEFTYKKSNLVFARPIKVFIPDFLAWFSE